MATEMATNATSLSSHPVKSDRVMHLTVIVALPTPIRSLLSQQYNPIIPLKPRPSQFYHPMLSSLCHSYPSSSNPMLLFTLPLFSVLAGTDLSKLIADS